jgi:multicomponent Na+:H+ antiporter subunit G
MNLLADILLLIGCLFVAIGSLGLLRMPDVYNRLQAGTKAVTLGSMSILLGIAVHFPQWWPKILVIAGFVLLTNPLGSSTVARTALLNGMKPWHKEEGD